MLRKPSIIGTGLSGLVGSRIRELLEPDYTFTNLDLTANVDITQPTVLRQAMKKTQGEAVIHLAAFTDVDAAHEQQGEKNGSCYRANVVGTRTVAQYCAQAGLYLVHVSTDFVFDGNKRSSYKEYDPPHPIEWYGQTKYWAEREVENAGGESVIIRIAYPFRAVFTPKLDLVRTILLKLEQDALYPMFVDQVITPTFVDDIARAIAIILEKRPTGIYHIVGSSSLTPYTLARKVAATFGFAPSRVERGRLVEYRKTARRPYQQLLKLSNAKAKRELGVQMKTIDEALEDMRKQRDFPPV